jgi:hypothetical protein
MQEPARESARDARLLVRERGLREGEDRGVEKRRMENRQTTDHYSNLPPRWTRVLAPRSPVKSEVLAVDKPHFQRRVVVQPFNQPDADDL